MPVDQGRECQLGGLAPAGGKPLQQLRVRQPGTLPRHRIAWRDTAEKTRSGHVPSTRSFDDSLRSYPIKQRKSPTYPSSWEKIPSNPDKASVRRAGRSRRLLDSGVRLRLAACRCRKIMDELNLIPREPDETIHGRISACESISAGRRPARRRSSSLVDGLRQGRTHQTLWASPARARRSPWPT